jgi:hypothetical protein
MAVSFREVQRLRVGRQYAAIVLLELEGAYSELARNSGWQRVHIYAAILTIPRNRYVLKPRFFENIFGSSGKFGYGMRSL